MATVLLAHPLFLAEDEAERASASSYFPLGILYLASYVRERGHTVVVFDGTFAPDRTAFDDALAEHQPDVVGLSGLLPTRSTALDLAATAKRSGAVVLAGGPDPTAEPHAYLADGSIDVVVHHEGELTIASLLDHIDGGPLTYECLAAEPGIAFRREGRVVVNAARPPIDDLDALPLPARDLIDVERYLDHWEAAAGYRSLTVSISRGCPTGCAWCADAVHGQGFRQRSPERVAAEVKAIADAYELTSLRFVDDVDEIERSWFERWAEEAELVGAAVPFEALNELTRRDLPLLDVQDTL